MASSCALASSGLKNLSWKGLKKGQSDRLKIVETAWNHHRWARKTQTTLQASHSSFILLFTVMTAELEIPL